MIPKQSKILMVNLLIHSFALAHAITAALLFNTSFGDDVLLTILTIAMIVTIARLYNCPMEVAAALALLGCFAGFYLGTRLPELIPEAGDWIHSLTTAVITEILGWVTFVIVKRKVVSGESN